ncbi:hypothetical protein HMPREF0973_02937 [Prevotella veroralis F0319]|uniref:Uncharacterized protein n=1 Tax=Prevotella veroralis F0319 TaxID=649761 RepID=C9MTG2_9BACT|nr:hypothetical protein HMPREF0973_02937 [Prevotella veroralis F0319]
MGFPTRASVPTSRHYLWLEIPILTNYQQALLPLGEAGWGFQRGRLSLLCGATSNRTNNLQPVNSCTCQLELITC